MSKHSFYQNRRCEYFPCHRRVPEDDFNCMFCYCPLYMLGEECGGNFSYTENGIKDCSRCILPHQRKNYEWILSKMDMVMERAKKKENQGGMP